MLLHKPIKKSGNGVVVSIVLFGLIEAVMAEVIHEPLK